MIIASFYLSPLLRFGVLPGLHSFLDWSDLAAIMTYSLVFYIFDFYNLEGRLNTFGYTVRFLVALMVADFIIGFLFYIFNIRPYATIIFLLNTILILFFCLAWRILFIQWNKQLQKIFRVLIIGAGWAGNDLSEILEKRMDFKIAGFLDDDPAKWGTKINSASVIGGTELLNSTMREKSIDIIIIAVTHRLNQDLYKRLVDAKMRGVSVYEMPSFYEILLGKIPVQHVSDLWFVYIPISGVRKTIFNQKIKRMLDIIISLLGLAITLPVNFFTALAIKCDSKGPVFYHQKRIGWRGQPFSLIKFRSMKVDSESDRQFAGDKNDPRITRVGRIIRLFRIDEIPQMWNVIKGEMSFIGPRALMEEEVDEFTPQIPYFSLRHSIRPGITGWAQINYPHGTTVKDAMSKLEYDIYYIKNLSPQLDLIILARTIRTVLLGRGAR